MQRIGPFYCVVKARALPQAVQKKLRQQEADKAGFRKTPTPWAKALAGWPCRLPTDGGLGARPRDHALLLEGPPPKRQSRGLSELPFSRGETSAAGGTVPATRAFLFFELFCLFCRRFWRGGAGTPHGREAWMDRGKRRQPRGGKSRGVARPARSETGKNGSAAEIQRSDRMEQGRDCEKPFSFIREKGTQRPKRKIMFCKGHEGRAFEAQSAEMQQSAGKMRITGESTGGPASAFAQIQSRRCCFHFTFLYPRLRGRALLLPP